MAVLKNLEGNTFSEDFDDLEYSHFPNENGLFPFMEDYSSSYYLWHGLQGNGADPEVVVWLTGPSVSIGHLSIAEMILGYIRGDGPMVDVWGDVIDNPSDRLVIDPRL